MPKVTQVFLRLNFPYSQSGIKLLDIGFLVCLTRMGVPSWPCVDQFGILEGMSHAHYLPYFRSLTSPHGVYLLLKTKNHMCTQYTLKKSTYNFYLIFVKSSNAHTILMIKIKVSIFIHKNLHSYIVSNISIQNIFTSNNEPLSFVKTKTLTSIPFVSL